MSRTHNFNAGPAALPLPVLERAQREMIDFEGTGMSLLEHSHRGATYEAVHNDAIARLRRVMEVPDDYEVLFLQGGASLQFAMIAMNFLPQDGSADYIVTGAWSKKALAEAKRYGALAGGKARAAADMHVDGVCSRVPQQDELDLDPGAAYVHVTSNNTIFGTQFHEFPDTGKVPMVVDMSSDILWRPIDVRQFGMIYAGAQKNVGPSGLAIVVLQRDLLARARKDAPSILQYAVHAEQNSLYNTPNSFAIYMVRNVLEHLEDVGGLAAVEKLNRAKATLLYEEFDGDFYRCPVEESSRSVMNVVFRLPTEELEKRFVTESQKAGLVGLKGHRSVGGMRASIYNAVPMASVEALVAFMQSFRKSA
ncbi:MAG: 3-phosphoserine/phosphohydroxythreonine transaminase [Polyangiaceae bacterium]